MRYHDLCVDDLFMWMVMLVGEYLKDGKEFIWSLKVFYTELYQVIRQFVWPYYPCVSVDWSQQFRIYFLIRFCGTNF